MRRRLLFANLIVVAVVLIILEVPLALVYSRHEHDALNGALQRDAATLAAVAVEVVEHPGDHDVDALAQRFSATPGEIVTIVDPSGNQLTRPNVLSNDPDFAPILGRALGRQSVAGEFEGSVFVAVPFGTVDQPLGAVVVARSDNAIDDRVQNFWFLLAGLGVGVLSVSLLVTTLVTRWVVEPLRRLDKNAAALGRGELTVRADASAGPDEVSALASTFNEMADRLQGLVTSQRRFVADASHQLRTPLTALRLRLESLDPAHPASIAAIRDASLDEAARLTRLVDGLLSLARAEGRHLERERIDVSAVLAERQEAWAPLAAEQAIELRLMIDSSHSSALLVRGHLEQILDNLIDNALDASPPGRTVVLWARNVGASLEVHVIDEGRGMSDEERHRAFDPFWQGSDGRATGSTGLGLAIAQQLARACRGTITLDRSDSGGIDAVVRFGPDRDID